MAALYVYDETINGTLGLGQRTSMHDASGETSWRYDARGRVIEELREVDGVAGSFKTAWEYNSADMPTRLHYSDGNTGNTGEAVTTTYLSQGPVFAVVGSIVYASNTKYDAAGRMLSQDRRSKQQKLSMDYFGWTEQDGVGRLKTIQGGTNVSPASYLSLAYTYDPLGNVQKIQEATNSSQEQTFGYDELSRLKSASTNGMGSGQYNQSYTYNATTGNLETKGLNSYSYSDVDHPHAVTQIQNLLVTNTYDYDANGNMIERELGSTTYTLAYDHESRLTSVVGGNTNEQYTYDGDGARIKVVSGNTTTVYIGDYYEYKLSGVGIGGTTSTATRSYYYAGSQRLAVRGSSTGLTTLYGDHLGSASVAVTSSGAVQRMRYKPWGEARGTSASAFATDRLFTGQIYDGDTSAGGTGLYFYNARYYDPALGRFTQADTIVPDPANPLAFDRYAYVYNSPLKYTDPSGHCAEADTWCWNNEWYNARGYFWSNQTGTWSRRSNPVFHSEWAITQYLREAGIFFLDVLEWSLEEMRVVAEGVYWTAQAVGGTRQLKSLVGGTYFQIQYQPGRLSWCSQIACTIGTQINIFRLNYFAMDYGHQVHTITHELAHVMDFYTGGDLSEEYYNTDPNRWHTEYAETSWLSMQENWSEGFTLWVYGWDSGQYSTSVGPYRVGSIEEVLSVDQWWYIYYYIRAGYPPASR